MSPASERLRDDSAMFANFPPCLVSYGGAEYLVDEILRLIKRLRLSEVPVTVVEIVDAPHDSLTVSWWNQHSKDLFWSKAEGWFAGKVFQNS